MTRTWLIVGLLAGIVAASLAGGWYLHLKTRAQAVAEYQRLQQHTADEIGALIETNVTATSKALVAIATTLPDATAAGLPPPARVRIEQQFASEIRCQLPPCFSSIALLERNGRVIAGSGPDLVLDAETVRKALEWAGDGRHDGLVRAVMVSEAPPAVVLITPVRPVTAAGPAVLAGRIELGDLFERQQLANAAMGQASETFVVENDGWVVFHSAHPEMRLNNVKQPSERCFACHDSFDYVKRMLSGGRGTMQFRAGGVSQLAAYATVQLPGDRWVVAVKTPRTMVIGRLSSDLRAMLAATVLLAGLGAIISALLWNESQRRIRAEAAAAHQAQTAALFTAMREGVVLHRLIRDDEGRPVDHLVLDVNLAFEKITGIRRTDAIGRRGSELHGSAPPFIDAYANVVATGEPIVIESFVPLLKRTFSISAVKIGPESFATVFEDLTEQRSLEQQFRQAQKMEAIGRLAGGVAHDFNNMLTAIIGFAELALAEMPDGAPYRTDIEEVKKAGENAATVTRQLLAFSRRQVVEPRTLDLNEQLRGQERFLTRLIGEDVAVVVRESTEPPVVVADPSQIEQVVMNLAVNARDAMPGGGTLTIEIGHAIVDDRAASACFDATPGRYVTLAVCDTGVGMSPDVQAHLFEPFFTTKERGKGTGLGLATVYGIVKQSGGFIRVESTIGRGSRFTIHLPAARSVQTGTAEAVAAAAGGSESILIVEDDATVRQLTKTMLERAGYSVMAAESGEAALAALNGGGVPVDLVLTDVVMPGLSGTELAERLRARPDRPRILMMSGYTGDRAQHEVAAGHAFIQKPFTAESLTRTVRSVLAMPEAQRPRPEA